MSMFNVCKIKDTRVIETDDNGIDSFIQWYLCNVNITLQWNSVYVYKKIKI